jgi:predicted lipoprotein with Yx(FWY)xxD motif
MEQTNQPRQGAGRVPLLVTAVALAVGGLSSSLLVASAGDAASTHPAKRLVISTSKDAQIGTILVSGRTLYTLQAGKTPCNIQCLKVWPEVLLPKGVTRARAGAGVNAAKLGTVTRSHGALQVTYSGKPLYRFSGDKAPGQVLGMGTNPWGTWSVVVTAKLAPTTSPSASPTPALPATPSGTGSSQPPATLPTPPTSPTPMTVPPTPVPAPAPMPAPTTPTPSPTTTTTAPSTGGVAF